MPAMSASARTGVSIAAAIAIASFATNQETATAANAGGTGALGQELARVVFNDLRDNGLFRPTGPDTLPRPSYTQITNPAWPTWQGRNAEMLVQGYVRPGADGQLAIDTAVKLVHG